MKKGFLSLLCVLLCTLGAFAQVENNTMYINSINAQAGDTIDVSVYLNNPDQDFISSEFDLYLPDGVYVLPVGTGKYAISTGSRMGDHQILAKTNNDGSTKIATYSMSNSAFSGDSGDILVIRLVVSKDIEGGEYDVVLANQLLTTPQITSVTPDDFMTLISISKEGGIVTPDTPDFLDNYFPLITSVAQLSSPFTCKTEGSLDGLLDGDDETYWHSEWMNGNVEGGHYLQVELTESTSGLCVLYMKRRYTVVDHPSVINIIGSNDEDFSTILVDIEVEMPNAEPGLESFSEDWIINTPIKYLRITPTDCEPGSFRGYWHTAELQLYCMYANVDSIMLSNIVSYIDKIAEYPTMQSELQEKLNVYLDLPEDTDADTKTACLREATTFKNTISKAIQMLNEIKSNITLAETIVAELGSNDDVLKQALADAKLVGKTSSSTEIFLANTNLINSMSEYVGLLAPMEQWNFDYNYTVGKIQYALDRELKIATVNAFRNGLDNVLNIPSTISYNDETYTVVQVRNYDYNDYSNVTSVILPNTLLRLDYRAFCEFNNLSYINLPKNLREIGQDVFSYCYSLKKITLESLVPPTMTDNSLGWDVPENLRIFVADDSYDSYASHSSWGKYSILPQTPITVQVSLSESGDLGWMVLDAVGNLNKVNKLIITSGELNSDDWNVIKSMSNLISLDIQGTSNVAIPNYQFESTILEEIKLPNNLQTIGEAAFRNASIKELLLPSTVNTLHYEAFANCKQLEQVNIPGAINRLENRIFASCSSLKNVTLGEGLEYIGYDVFYECGLREIIMPSSLKEIQESAFANNRYLTKITLNEGLLTISNGCFRDCDALTSIVIPSTVLNCAYSPFRYCDNLKDIYAFSVIPAKTNGSCPVTGTNISDVTIYVSAISKIDYQTAEGWSQFSNIVATDYMPANIIVDRNYILRVDMDSVAAGYSPNLSLIWTNNSMYDIMNNYAYSTGNLTIHPTGTFNANSFSMYYSPYAKYNHDELQLGNWYSYTQYNTNTLIVKGTMRAETTTIRLMNHSNKWSFICFPFDVRVGDIIPVDSTTQWVIRKYDGAKRAEVQMDHTWVNLTADDVMKAGCGYIMHCYNDVEPVMFDVMPMRNSVTRQNIFKSTDLVIELEEHQSEFAHNSSWNLIGNPYPAYYDISFTDFTAPITVWDSRYSNYVAISPLDDNYALMPGEAFFVQRPVDQSSITFAAEGRQNNHYVHDKNNGVSSRISANKLNRNVFNFELTGEKSSDRTRIVLNENASLNYELSCDASKFDALISNSVQLYSISGNQRFAINERPLNDGKVMLGFVVSESGNYTFSTKLSDNEKVILYDRENCTTLDLTVNNQYEFYAEEGVNNSRFCLYFDIDATAIEQLESEHNSQSPIYNVAGQRITNINEHKGVLIQGGKKTLK